MRRTRLIMGLLLAATLAAGFSLWEPDRSRDELAHWLNDASRFVAVAGSDAHYRREGTPGAPVLLLLHGTSSSLHTWDGWVSRLADDYDIVRVDLPGFGLTGPRADRDYTVSAYVAFLERFVARLGLTQFTIAGNSLGGNIAWRFAATAPEQVNAVVLLDPSGFPVEGKSLPLAFRLARTPLVNQTLSLFTPRRLFQTSLEEVYADDSLVTPALVDRYWELTLHAGNRQAFVDRANQQEDQPTHLLRTIAAPVLVLWGAEDTWIPVEHAQKFSAMLPNATTLIYPDLGHVPMEEAPLRTAEDVRRFLQEYSNATDHAGH